MKISNEGNLMLHHEQELPVAFLPFWFRLHHLSGGNSSDIPKTAIPICSFGMTLLYPGGTANRVHP